MCNDLANGLKKEAAPLVQPDGLATASSSSAALIQTATKGLPQKKCNQDAAKAYRGSRFNALAVADGVGSALDAQSASAIAVDTFLRQVATFDQSERPLTEIAAGIQEFWDSSLTALDDLFARDPQRYEQFRGSPVLETTLLTALDIEDRYIVSYVGNGSVFYVRGDFDAFRKRWPWAVVNLAAGQAVLNADTGKDELQYVLAPQRAKRPQPVVVEHSKNVDHGEAILLCTDGISSPEQARVGYDSDHRLWTEINPHLIDLVQGRLTEFLASLAISSNPAGDLLITLDRFLAERSFDDDASIGIILSQPLVLRYRARAISESASRE